MFALRKHYNCVNVCSLLWFKVFSSFEFCWKNQKMQVYMPQHKPVWYSNLPNCWVKFFLYEVIIKLPIWPFVLWNICAPLPGLDHIAAQCNVCAWFQDAFTIITVFHFNLWKHSQNSYAVSYLLILVQNIVKSYFSSTFVFGLHRTTFIVKFLQGRHLKITICIWHLDRIMLSSMGELKWVPHDSYEEVVLERNFSSTPAPATTVAGTPLILIGSG